MSKIEDDTTRGGRDRSGLSASIERDPSSGRSDLDARDSDGEIVEDLDGDPIVVPANDDWSVDDDGAAPVKADSRLDEPDRGWKTQTLPGLEPTSNGHGSTGSNGTAKRSKISNRSADKVKRFAVDEPADTGNGNGNGRASARTDVPRPPATSELPVISVDDEDGQAVQATGPVPLVIHEQTAVEPSAADGRTTVVDRDDVDHAFDDTWTELQPAARRAPTRVVDYGTPAAGIAVPAVQPEVSRRRRVRRVNRVLRHIDPWSVFKVGLLFSIIGYIIVMTSGWLLWDVASRTGTLPNVERWFTQFGWETFELDGSAIFRNAAVAGLFAAVGLTGAMVMFATVFNLVSDAIGGIRVSVLEEEVVAVTDDGSVVNPGATPSPHLHGLDDWAVEDF